MLRRILISAGYVGLAILLAGFTFLLVAYGNDYTYDFSTHKIIQNGHVILSSFPTGLNVTADGRWLTKRTPYQAAYRVGTHTFSFQKDGYWTWQKTLEVVAGQVTLARYIILVPKNPQATVFDSKPQVVAQSISKDHRHLAYITGGQDPALYTLDLGNPKPVRLYAPAVATPTSPAEVLQNVTWSDDASHLLMSSVIGTAATYRLVAADGSGVTNLTDQFHVDLTGLKFSATNWRLMYWVAPDGLKRVDMGAGTISPVLADRVIQFWPETNDRVLYVQQTDLGDSLWSLDSHDHHQELIQALAASPAYAVAYSTYNGQDELAIVPSKTQTGTLYTGIFGDTPVAKQVATGVTDASFPPDGHLLLFSSPTNMVTYDIERSSIYDKSISYSITGQPGQLDTVTWFDNYHLLQNRGGTLYFSEFDGANRTELGPIEGVFPSYGTSDFRSLIAFKPEKASVSITQVLIKQ